MTVFMGYAELPWERARLARIGCTCDQEVHQDPIDLPFTPSITNDRGVMHVASILRLF